MGTLPAADSFQVLCVSQLWGRGIWLPLWSSTLPGLQIEAVSLFIGFLFLPAFNSPVTSLITHGLPVSILRRSLCYPDSSYSVLPGRNAPPYPGPPTPDLHRRNRHQRKSPTSQGKSSPLNSVWHTFPLWLVFPWRNYFPCYFLCIWFKLVALRKVAGGTVAGDPENKGPGRSVEHSQSSFICLCYCCISVPRNFWSKPWPWLSVLWDWICHFISPIN